MLTPLFPPNNATITLIQGKRIGDCYFLAAIDCIMNARDEGYEKIKSLFTQTKDGVIVRIKCSVNTRNLTPQNLHGKYTYHYDRTRQEDVFFINWKQLTKIDQDPNGVTTNSLAVKILERLISYYYTKEWIEYTAPQLGHPTRRLTRATSLSAHNLDQRVPGGCPLFVADFLNLEALALTDIDLVMKLYNVFPQFQIYLGRNYGPPNASGEIERHAFRIDQITPTAFSADDSLFVLANPWDNRRREIHKQVDLVQNKCAFCFFGTNKYLYELLLALSSNLDLLNMICEIKKIKSPITYQEIKCYIKIYHLRPDIAAIFSSFSASAKQTFILYISTVERDVAIKLLDEEILGILDAKIRELQFAQQQVLDEAHAYIASRVQVMQRLEVRFNSYSATSVDVMRNILIAKLKILAQHDFKLKKAESAVGFTAGVRHPRIAKAIEAKLTEINTAAQQRLKFNEAQKIVGQCIAKIQAFQCFFDPNLSFQQIDQHKTTLHSQLDDIVADFPEITMAASTLGYLNLRSRDIAHALQIKSHYITRLAIDAKSRINSYVQQLIQSISFSHYLELLEKAIATVSWQANRESLFVASSLLEQLHAAQNDCLSSTESCKVRISKFQSRTLQAIQEAMPYFVNQPGLSRELNVCLSNLRYLTRESLPITSNHRLRMFDTPVKAAAIPVASDREIIVFA